METQKMTTTTLEEEEQTLPGLPVQLHPAGILDNKGRIKNVYHDPLINHKESNEFTNEIANESNHLSFNQNQQSQ